MFSAEDGVTLLEALAPPDGFTVDVAVGTTYTLDLQALLAVPTAFALHRSSTDHDADTTPLELLEALRSHTGRLSLFTDAARIALPPSRAGSGVLGLLERAVVPVAAPRGGAFHPKIWALRYVDPDGRHIHRLLVASRNVTFDRSWDTLVRLDEHPDGHPLPPLAGMLRHLPGLAVHTIRAEHTARVTDLATTINGVRFEAPPGIDALTLHPIGFTEQAGGAWPFPGSARRTLLVSPFLTRGAVRKLARTAPGDVTLVSRPDELDRACADRPVADRPAAWVVNPNLVDAPDDATTLSDLHAKLVVMDLPGSRTRIWTGSANITSAALGVHADSPSNTEVLVEMDGPTSQVGVRRWLAEDTLSFRRDMLLPHAWSEPQPATTPVEDALDHLRTALALLLVVGDVTETDDDRFSVHYRNASPLPDLGEATLEVRPLGHDTWHRVEGSIDLTVDVAVTGLTSLFGARLSLAGLTADLVLVSDLSGVPDDREERLLAVLIARPDRLLRYLLMLLTGHPTDRFDGTLQALERTLGQSTGSAGLTSVPLLELLLRTLSRDPGRLAAVGRLMDVVRTSPHLRDEKLLALWDAVRTLAPATPEVPR